MNAKRAWILGWSSAGGLGYAPWAPGTFGTLGALPLWWAMQGLPLVGYVAVTAVLTAAAVWVSGRAEAIYGEHDVKQIVIDEVVGLLVATVGVPFRWPQILAAFVLFRLFDIAKPFPIRWLDRNVGGGLGVVLDDVAAGLAALAVLHGGRVALGGWW